MNNSKKLHQRFIPAVIPAQAGIHLVFSRHNTPCGSTGFFTVPICHSRAGGNPSSCSHNIPCGSTGLFILAVAGLVLLGLTGGCAPTASPETLDAQVAGAPADQAPLATQKITAVEDLPVPANMKINKRLSHSYEGSGSRMIDYTYSGWVDIRRVHRFYREQMPLHRWQLLTDNYIRGVYTMTFQKNRELCTVIIRKDLVFWTKVQMLIQAPQTTR